MHFDSYELRNIYLFIYLFFFFDQPFSSVSPKFIAVIRLILFWRSLFLSHTVSKTYHHTYAPNENWNQSAHRRSLIWASLSALRSFTLLAIQNAPSEDSDQPAHAQADLNIRWAHMSESTISDVVALMLILDGFICTSWIWWSFWTNSKIRINLKWYLSVDRSYHADKIALSSKCSDAVLRLFVRKKNKKQKKKKLEATKLLIRHFSQPKSIYIFLISRQKHMFLVLIRSAWLRHF